MMDDHPWPLYRKLPPDYSFFTKATVAEFLEQFHDDTPVWIDNYWQPIRQITQRPIWLIGGDEEGIHFG